ncbi:MAG TPA: efflux RND transporter periplasmic adaptor subunit [Candidatus Acidoferrum sp.]|nr:efflux RND transporter periplasmic adaptor subunit [Candidatus Acidoferrum sp.]
MNTKPLLLIPILMLAGCAKKQEAEVEAPAVVQVTAVQQDTIRRTVAGDGTLWPRNQASVMPKIAAPVQRFLVQRGDHVKEGQVVAVLEARDLTAGAGESRAQLAQAEANLRSTQSATVPDAVVKAQTDVDAARQADETAKRLLDNRKNLQQQGALARKLVDDAEVAYVQAHSNLVAAQEHLRTLQTVGKGEQINTAAAQVEAAKNHLQSTEAQVGYSQIHSPISGVIADRPLYAGEMAVPGTPLLTVMDISKVVARVNVPQNQVASIKVGDPATITQPDRPEPLDGKVSVVSPATDAATTTVQVWIEIDNPGGKLKPGTSVHALIVTEAIKAATVIPVAAVLPGEEGGTAVLVITPDNVAHRRAVTLGVREGDKVQVLNGARPGEEVVTVGGLGLDDKAKVKVVTPGAPEEAEEPDPGDEKPSPSDAKKKDEAKPKSK